MTRVAAITFDGALLRKTCEDDPRFGYASKKRLLLLVTELLEATRMQVADLREDARDSARYDWNP